MPTYTYKCDEHEFDLYLPFVAYTPEVNCPVCDGEATRVWNTPPVIFRPDGWNLSPNDPMYSRNLKDKEERFSWQQ